MLIRDPWLRALSVLGCAIAGIYLVGLLWQVIQEFSDIILLFFLAWWFGDSLQQLIMRFERGVEHYLRPLLILVALSAVACYLVYHFLRHPVSTGDPDEVPQVVQLLSSAVPTP